HLYERVHFADVAQEFVTEAFPLRGAFDQAGYIHELNRRRNERFYFDDARQLRKASIGNADDAKVGIDRAKGIVFSRGFMRTSQCVEQCGFSHIGQTDDPRLQHGGMLTFAAVAVHNCITVWPSRTASRPRLAARLTAEATWNFTCGPWALGAAASRDGSRSGKRCQAAPWA